MSDKIRGSDKLKNNCSTFRELKVDQIKDVAGGISISALLGGGFPIGLLAGLRNVASKVNQYQA